MMNIGKKVLEFGGEEGGDGWRGGRAVLQCTVQGGSRLVCCCCCCCWDLSHDIMVRVVLLGNIDFYP